MTAARCERGAVRHRAAASVATATASPTSAALESPTSPVTRPVAGS